MRSFSARCTTAFTRSGLYVRIRAAVLDNWTISQSRSPHSRSSAMLGLITFSMFEKTIALFLFKILRSVSKDPTKGIQNSSLGDMSPLWRPLAPPDRRMRTIWGSDKPTRSRRAVMRRPMLCGLMRRIRGSAAMTTARSARERPRPERIATTASGLEGDLRLETFLEASSAWAPVRPHVPTRYSSTEKGVAVADLAAAELRRLRCTEGDAAAVEGRRRRSCRGEEKVEAWKEARSRGRRWFRRRSMAEHGGGAGEFEAAAG
uniref:Uncharacterized protein n=1 Tax=Oryza brachyantha TaxID=4533 RepID=J3MUM8_ORYBR